MEHLATADYAAHLAAEGITTVALDYLGRMIEHIPDGTTRALDDELMGRSQRDAP